MTKKTKTTLLATSAGLLVPAVVGTAVSCKTPDSVLQNSLNQLIEFQPTDNATKVTSAYIVDNVNKMKHDGKSSKEIKEYLRQFITNWPHEEKHVSILPIDVQVNKSDDRSLFMTLSYKIKNKEEIITNTTLPMFRSQHELSQVYVKSALKKDWVINVNTLNLSKTSAVEAAKRLNAGTEEYTKYFVGIPTQVEGDNSAWGALKNDYLTTGMVTVEQNTLKFEPVDESELKVIATYKYNDYSEEKTYVVKGFANLTDQFNEKILNIKPIANLKAGLVAPSSITVDNVNTYVDGIPRSELDFVVKIDKIVPKQATPTNKVLSITMTFSNPASKDLVKTITYDISGFASENEVNTIDVDEAINDFISRTFVANQPAKSKLPSEINKANIYSYVDNIPKQIGLTNIVCSNVRVESEATGTIAATFTFTQGEITKESSVYITGFLTSANKDQLDVNEMRDLGLSNLTTTSKAATVLPSVVNGSNYEEYVEGWPELKNGVQRRVVVIPNNTVGMIELNVTYFKNNASSITLSKQLYGFKTESSVEQETVDKAAQSFGTLQASASAKNTFIKEVKVSNITSYVDGWSWQPGSSNSDGVFLNVESVSVKSNSNGTYESNTIEIVLKFSKGRSQTIIKREVSGFVSEKQNDTNIVEAMANSTNLGTTFEAMSTRVTDVNTGNYSQYITGININNDKGVTVLVRSIAPKNTTDKNEILNVVLQFSRGQVNKTITKEVGPFLSTWNYWQNKLFQLAESESQKVTLQITEAGKNVVASVVTPQNITNYVQGIPTQPDGINLQITNVFLSPTDETKIDVEFTYSYILQSGVVSASFVSSCSGFRTQEVQIKIDLDNAVKNQQELAVTVEGTKVVASKVNKINFNTYVAGILTPEQNNGVHTIIDSVTVSPNNDQQLSVVLHYEKGIYKSTTVTKIVNGFKNVTLQNTEDVNAALLAWKDKNLAITEAGKKVISSVVNTKNINTYVSGMPTNLENEVELVIQSINPTDGKLTIIYYFSKGKQQSTQITKEVSGFRLSQEQDKLDVEAVVNSGFTLAVTQAGANAASQMVTIDNADEYIQGWPTATNNVTIEKVSIKPKTTDITDETNVTIVLVELKFTKDTYSITKTYEVFGFRRPTETEIFNYQVDQVVFKVSELGTKTVAYNITNENLDKQFRVEFKDNSLILTYPSFKVKDNTDGTEIELEVKFTKGNISKTKKITITGYKSKTLQSEENFVKQLENYQNITTQSNIGNVITKQLSDNPNLLSNYFNIPQSIQWISITTKVFYTGNDSNLSNTTLRVEWTIINDATKKEEKVNLTFYGFRDPFSNVISIEDKTIEVKGTRANSNGQYSNKPEHNGYLKATGQDLEVRWWYEDTLFDFLGQKDPNRWDRAMKSWAVLAFKSYVSDSNFSSELIQNSRNNLEWGKPWNFNWCYNSVRMKVHCVGYKSIEVGFKVKVGLINGYWH